MCKVRCLPMETSELRLSERMFCFQELPGKFEYYVYLLPLFRELPRIIAFKVKIDLWDVFENRKCLQIQDPQDFLEGCPRSYHLRGIS